jgi:hypothetical protein
MIAGREPVLVEMLLRARGRTAALRDPMDSHATRAGAASARALA